MNYYERLFPELARLEADLIERKDNKIPVDGYSIDRIVGLNSVGANVEFYCYFGELLIVFGQPNETGSVVRSAPDRNQLYARIEPEQESKRPDFVLIVSALKRTHPSILIR